MKMDWVFDIAGMTRQAHSKWLNKPVKSIVKSSQKDVLTLAKEIRKKHLPGSGVRNVYKFIRNNIEYDERLMGWSKHSFERLCLDNGLGIVAKRYIPKTTIHGGFKFENRIEGLVIFDTNKIWVSDISYIFGILGDLIGYATSLIDIYSRYLLGLVFSNTMKAEDTVIPLLKQSFAIRANDTFTDAYFHSDGGKQYIYGKFIKALRAKEIESSMARSCYENPFAESFNDTLKNHMLWDLQLTNYRSLKRHEKFIKYVYNHNKTHSGINDLTPAQYEINLKSIKSSERVGLKIKEID